MSKRFLCVFDLDGTFYPKESKITFELRKRVVDYIALRNSISITEAQNIYRKLPEKYPNPFDGLGSLNISGIEYQDIFETIETNMFVSEDFRLRKKLEKLNKLAVIVVVSLAPEKYIIQILKSLGIDGVVKQFYSVDDTSEYSKDKIFCLLSNEYGYDKMFSIGDSIENDLIPAQKYGFKTFDVNFDDEKKTIYHIIDLLYGDLVREQVPNIMRVENISFCNEKCIICPYESVKRSKGIMQDDLFKKIVVEHSLLAERPKLIFPASIGEPFMDKNFLDKLLFASNYYSDIAAFTNASLLTKENFLSYIKNGGTELMLTLHGFSKERYTYITKTDYYDVVRSNIERVAYLNYNSNKPIRLFLDVYADFSYECEQFVDKMKKLGVIAQRIAIENTHNWGGAVEGCSKKELSEHCIRIYEQFGIQFDGTVVPCCIDVSGKYILGNAKSQTIEEIFLSSQYNRLVELEKNGMIRKNELCTICNI